MRPYSLCNSPAETHRYQIAVLKEPAVVKRWEEIGAEPSTMTPAEVTRFVQEEIDKWTPVVKSSGAKPE